MIWRLLGTGQTQQAVADELGWTRTQIANYAALRAVDERAWNIVVTTVCDFAVSREDGAVTESVTAVKKRAPRLSPTYKAMSESEREAAWAFDNTTDGVFVSYEQGREGHPAPAASLDSVAAITPLTGADAHKAYNENMAIA
jgi:hypothetical protein